jgi:hypothetical protein
MTACLISALHATPGLEVLSKAAICSTRPACSCIHSSGGPGTTTRKQVVLASTSGTIAKKQISVHINSANHALTTEGILIALLESVCLVIVTQALIIKTATSGLPSSEWCVQVSLKGRSGQRGQKCLLEALLRVRVRGASFGSAPNKTMSDPRSSFVGGRLCRLVMRPLILTMPTPPCDATEQLDLLFGLLVVLCCAKLMPRTRCD